MRWILGDIHGMLKPLEVTLDAIARQDAQAKLYFAGDFVNRGPESKRVVDLLLTLKNALFVRGNHDDTFDLCLSGKSYTVVQQTTGIVDTFVHFLKYGLDQTLMSYGIDLAQIEHVQRKPSNEAIKELLAPVPASHREFFRNLPVIQDEEEFFVAHAKWDPQEESGEPSFLLQLARSLKLRHELIWGRFTAEEIDRTKIWTRTGFFGHTPVTTYRRGQDLMPVVGKKVVLLDTAAAVNMDGRLTAWCFEENRCIQVHRDGDIVPAVTSAGA